MFKPTRYEFKETIFLPGKRSEIYADAKDYDVHEDGNWFVFVNRNNSDAVRVHVSNVRYVMGTYVEEAKPKKLK